MKLNSKQVTVLAQKVANEIRSKRESNRKESVVKDIREFIKVRDKNNKVIETLEDENKKALDKLKKKYLGNQYAYFSNNPDENQIYKTLTNQDTISLNYIENEIVLKAMFATEGDMESFVSQLVEKFS